MKHELDLSFLMCKQRKLEVDEVQVLAVGSGVAIVRPRQTDDLVGGGPVVGGPAGRDLRQGSSGRAGEMQTTCGGRGGVACGGGGKRLRRWRGGRRRRRGTGGRGRRREAKPCRLSGRLSPCGSGWEAITFPFFSFS
jgi:hypothetical protein